MRKSILILLLLNCMACTPKSLLTTEPSSHDSLSRSGSQLVVEWNETILSLAEAEDGLLTLKGVRTAAMAHLAMHDILAVHEGVYEPFALASNKKFSLTDPIAAASQAAYVVVSALYPDQDKNLKILNARWLKASLGNSTSSAEIVAGTLAGRTVLDRREGDGWNTQADYQWHPMAPGVYAEFNEHSGTPDGFIFGAGWALARGFALESPDQFRSPPPPAISSEDYTKAFDEVASLGRFQSIERTPDQTHLALWWKDFAERSHNRLARELVRRESMTAVEANRLFALLNMSIFDAYISSFDNKFHYNHWRPYTAIRWADNDGNPDTLAEDTWTNTHRHTYAFPSYPSAHGTACASAMTVFAEVFGDNYRFSMRTDTVDVAGPFSGKINLQPPTREFTQFSQAANECALSRLYLGIHFRYDSTAGFNLGQKVGDLVVNKLLVRK